MPICNLREYSDNYSKRSGSLWQYYRDKAFINNFRAIPDFPANNNSRASFKFKMRIAARIENDGTKNVKIRVVPLKYLSNFWRALKVSLINCEINLILTWSDRCFIIDNPIANQEPTFTISDTKIHVPVVTLSTQNNGELLQQLKSSFKRRINGINMNQK